MRGINLLSQIISIERLSGLLALVMIGAMVLARVGEMLVPHAASLMWISAYAAVALALIRIRSVHRIARVFAIGALIVAGIIVTLRPEGLPALKQAIFQGTAFSAFLTSLGLIRTPVRASQVVSVAAAQLFSYPAKMRNAVMTYGAQAFSVLFNIGTISMMSDMAVDHAKRATKAGKSVIDPRPVTLSALRGTIMMTVWNPIGVGFAIVTTAIPTLDAVTFLGLSFACAMLITAGGLIISHYETTKEPQFDGEAEEDTANGRALWAILFAVVLLILVTLSVHHVLHVSFLVAACIVLPLLSILWPYIEPTVRQSTAGTRSQVKALGEASCAMANEATMFFCAAVIGAGASIFLTELGIADLIESGALPMLAIILACLFLVPLAGALLIPHSIVMIMAAQLFGTGPIGQAHPYALALGLCFSWACAISASPISAMSIITGRQLGTSPSRVTSAINRNFTFYCLLVCAALVSIIYYLE
jgi:hypothetical protein